MFLLYFFLANCKNRSAPPLAPKPRPWSMGSSERKSGESFISAKLVNNNITKYYYTDIKYEHTMATFKLCM